MFGTFAVLYLFCGGTGAGAIAVCSLADLAWARQPFGTGTYTQGPSVRPEARIVDFGFAAGLALLVLGIACLLLDLGRLDRVLMLFLNPQPTFVTVGAFALAALALLGGFLAAVRFLYVPAVRRGAVAAAEAVAVAVGVVAMLYTGLLLQTMGGIAFWASPFVPLLFLLSSLSGGMALVLLAALFVERTPPTGQLTGFLARTDLLVVVLEIACVAGFLLWAQASGHPGVRVSLAQLAEGDVARAWWIGFCACGLAVPLGVEVAGWASGALRSERAGWSAAFAVAAALVLVGGWCLRWSMVEAGGAGERARAGGGRCRDGRRAGAHAGGRRRGGRRRALRLCVRARAAARRSCRRAVFRQRRACGVCVCGAQWGGGFAVCFGRGGRLRDGECRRVRSWRAKVRRGAWQ